MLQNAYFLAKIGADTAENEQHFADILPKLAAALAEDPVYLYEVDAKQRRIQGYRLRQAGLELAWVRRELARKISKFLQIVWRARSRLYQNEICKKICV